MADRFFDRDRITQNVVKWQSGQREPSYYLKKKD